MRGEEKGQVRLDASLQGRTKASEILVIEICRRNNKVTSKIIENTIWLVKRLKDKYNGPYNRLERYVQKYYHIIIGLNGEILKKS